MSQEQQEVQAQPETEIYFEVQTRTGVEPHDRFSNVWNQEIEVNGKIVRSLVTFPTFDAAKKELDEHQSDMDEAGIEYQPRDFKIKRRKRKVFHK